MQGKRKIIIHHCSENYRGKVVANAHILHLKGIERGFGGIPYHFVIGNGEKGRHKLKAGFVYGESVDGGLELGKPLHNTKEDIAICLVGNFNTSKPTPKQLKTLKYLVLYLLYKYKITPDNVLGHREYKIVDKKCPGKNFDMAAFRAVLWRAYDRTTKRKGDLIRKIVCSMYVPKTGS